VFNTFLAALLAHPSISKKHGLQSLPAPHGWTANARSLLSCSSLGKQGGDAADREAFRKHTHRTAKPGRTESGHAFGTAQMKAEDQRLQCCSQEVADKQDLAMLCKTSDRVALVRERKR